MAIPENLLLARLGALLPLPANLLWTRDGADFRIRLLILLVTATLAFVTVAPDIDLGPAASRLVQRVRTLALLASCARTIPVLATTDAIGAPPAISPSVGNTTIIDLTCSRLC